MKIRIKNLRLRTVIGINEWERKVLQDIVVNLEFDFDGSAAAASDRIEDTVNYKKMTKRIIEAVEKSSFYLLERLAEKILGIVMEDSRVLNARVEVDKPHALRFADSVSVSSERSQNG